MPYARSKAARLREFGRLARQINAKQREVDALVEKRNALLLSNLAADDGATSDEIGAVSGDGFKASAVRSTLKRLRDRR